MKHMFRNYTLKLLPHLPWAKDLKSYLYFTFAIIVMYVTPCYNVTCYNGILNSIVACNIITWCYIHYSTIENERRHYICNVFSHWLRTCSAIDRKWPQLRPLLHSVTIFSPICAYFERCEFPVYLIRLGSLHLSPLATITSEISGGSIHPSNRPTSQGRWDVSWGCLYWTYARLLNHESKYRSDLFIILKHWNDRGYGLSLIEYMSCLLRPSDAYIHLSKGL